MKDLMNLTTKHFSAIRKGNIYLYGFSAET